MTLRRKTHRKATFDMDTREYNRSRVAYVIDCRDFWILREYVDHGRGFTRTGDEQWIGKGLIEALHGLSYHLGRS